METKKNVWIIFPHFSIKNKLLLGKLSMLNYTNKEKRKRRVVKQENKEGKRFRNFIRGTFMGKN